MITPKYIFNKNEIERCYLEMAGLMEECDLHYALKANSEVGVLKILNGVSSKFEIASLEEYKKLRKINVYSDRIICGLPIKKIEMINYLYNDGCNYFVFDDFKEFNKIKTHALYSKKILRVQISDLIPDNIEFGMNIENINNADLGFWNEVDGLSFHVTNNVDIGLLFKVLDRIESMILKISKKKDIILNIGGGYRLSTSAEFYDALNGRLREFKRKYGVYIISEPGEAIIKTAGRIITKVISVRERQGVFDVFLDAGFATGINRKPGFVKLHNSIRVMEKSIDRKIRIYRFYDITCLHRELFVYPLRFDILDNDYLELGDLGSYSISLSNNFHGWMKPKIEYI